MLEQGRTLVAEWSCSGLKSLNFEFLFDVRPELQAVGAFAEQYAQTDPPSAPGEAARLPLEDSGAAELIDQILHDQSDERYPSDARQPPPDATVQGEERRACSLP